MVDLRLIREQPDAFRAALRKKRADPRLVDRVLEVDRRRRELVQDVEALRAAQNRASQEIPRLTGPAREERIAAMKRIAAQAKAQEPALQAADATLEALLLQIPNPPHPSVPDGGPEDSVTLRVVGAPPQFGFPPRDHVDLGAALDLLDVERSAKVSGSRFYFLRRDGALLQLALIRYAVDRLGAEGFIPTIPPVLVKRENMIGMMGGIELDEQMVYRIEGEDLALAGTSEMALGSMYLGEVLREADLPIRLCGVSTCFRREAGAHGKDTRGMFRVHQFDKVEMFSYCHPDRSWEEHDYLLALQERLWKDLGLPYRVVNIAAGDLGDPAARKYDIETWMPGRGGYGETQSCSNCTDFQARRLNIRFRPSGGGGLGFVHTLNGTAVAGTRAIIAILENNQQADGSVHIPRPLVPYMGGRTLLRPPSPPPSGTESPLRE
ncbi:MAG: serine--tRNA ligase [Armatimonadetes bacterium 13_1_40CM_3_65_7]|nr:MAG: serine--tRNA ligase [Armatimonadetes bacterium 13_1_40CM_3_65_7]